MKESNTAERLQYIISSRNLKQVDIINMCRPYCDKYGVKLGKNHLSQYVSGKFIPDQNKISILAMALGVSEAWLLGYDVPMIDTIKEMSLNSDETNLINIYRVIDDNGRKMINNVAALEYERCKK